MFWPLCRLNQLIPCQHIPDKTIIIGFDFDSFQADINITVAASQEMFREKFKPLDLDRHVEHTVGEIDQAQA